MDTDKVLYIAKKIVDHALELQETVSFLPGSPCATTTLPYNLSLGIPWNAIKQLVIGRSQTTAIDKKRTIHSSLENISHPIVQIEVW